MRRVAVVLVLFLALAGVVGFVAQGGLHRLGRGAGPAAGSGGAAPHAVPRGPALLAPAPAAGISAPGTASYQPAIAQPSPAPASLAVRASGAGPSVGPDIVRTATLSVRVRRGGFGGAFQRAAEIATAAGGYVDASSTTGTRSGWLEMRVPVRRFDAAMAALRALGTVTAASIRGQDVAGQVVDLGARLRAWQAEESVLLRLMAQATTIRDSLKVEAQLQQVQFQIEDLRGQLATLANQTALATITARLVERGAPRVHVAAGPRFPDLGRAWRFAAAGFLGVLFSVVVGLGYLVPIAVLGGAVWFAARRLRVRPAAAGG